MEKNISSEPFNMLQKGVETVYNRVEKMTPANQNGSKKKRIAIITFLIFIIILFGFDISNSFISLFYKSNILKIYNKTISYY